MALKPALAGGRTHLDQGSASLHPEKIYPPAENRLTLSVIFKPKLCP
jgi:hypothetical protein